ncbi:uncharacterized protein LOC129593025 isoform X2 [Paramacrobiotus metropolitanus]|uniref:uncharacterized protein LOC129593025 isoform X2 n=1 Tax=Paramacrobiotus metropolitanus TaxID=2943436 RepID=UPI002445C415|nr:uncharacterized protein LOC129593025 isoform X2 [Paramacrobiotus metropolitanus]
MKSAAAIITLWATVTLLLHYSGAESGNPGVEFGLNKINTGNGIVKSGSDADRPTRKKRCEKSCANPNPSPLCASNCDSTCICKPGLYRTFVPSPTCAPQNGPLLNNCKGNPQLRKG